MTKRLNSGLLTLLCAASLQAQINVAFVRHLAQQDLKREQWHYLSRFPDSDSIYYFKAAYYLVEHNETLFMTCFENSRELCLTDTLLTSRASSHLLTSENTSLRAAWFSSIASSNAAQGQLMAYRAALEPDKIKPETLPYELQRSFTAYRRSAHKSPWLGAGLSLVLPGAGKLYAGKTKTFFNSLVINLAYAAQTVESARRLGNTHAFTIVNASLFTLFYLSNVYGGYHAVIQLRKERKHQFLKDAADYYYR